MGHRALGRRDQDRRRGRDLGSGRRLTGGRCDVLGGEAAFTGAAPQPAHPAAQLLGRVGRHVRRGGLEARHGFDGDGHWSTLLRRAARARRTTVLAWTSLRSVMTALRGCRYWMIVRG